MQTKDQQIIEQIIGRDERALDALSEAYGAVCRSIARNILGDSADTEEVLNDALFKAWNAIPASPPAHLQAYMITLTRRIALDRCKWKQREKRGSGEVPLALSELEACIPAQETVESVCDRNALADALNRFLRTLPAYKRRIFIERYTMLMPEEEIAERHAMTPAAVKMQLSRIRKQLRAYLEKEGFL